MAIYMKIEGGSPTIKGNLQESTHQNWTELDSFSFGCGRSIISRTPGHMENREASTVSISEVSVSKEMDSSSPSLFEWACLGEAQTVTIEFTRTGSDGTPVVFTQYVLSHVLLSNYSTNGNGSGASLRESLSFNFDKIQFKYIDAKDDGSAESSPMIFTYDLAAATKG